MPALMKPARVFEDARCAAGSNVAGRAQQKRHRKIPLLRLLGGNLPSLLFFDPHRDGESVADFVVHILNSDDRPAEPLSQFDEILGNPDRAVLDLGIGADSGFVPRNQFGKRGAGAILVEGSLLMRRDDVDIATRADHAAPLLQRFDGIGKMFDHVRADDEIDAAVFERQLIAGRGDVHRQRLAAHADFFLLKNRDLFGEIDIARPEAEAVVRGAADLNAVETIQQFVSECALFELHEFESPFPDNSPRF